jgi:hypothetical protein
MVLSIVDVVKIESDTVDVHVRVTGAFELKVRYFSLDFMNPISWRSIFPLLNFAMMILLLRSPKSINLTQLALLSDLHQVAKVRPAVPVVKGLMLIY